MRSPCREPLLVWTLFLSACGPGKAETDATAGTTAGATAGTTADSSSSVTSGTTAGSAGTTEVPVMCMDLPVTPGGALGCDGAELVLDDPCDQLAGYELCSNHSVHRHTAVPCNKTEEFEPCAESNPVMSTCAGDSDCGAYPPGVCSGPDFYCSCKYPCTHDDECGAGAICVCNTGGSHPFYNYLGCMRAGCRSDADCDGAHCSLAFGRCFELLGFYCHTPEDECGGDRDCIDLDLGDRCAYSEETGRWYCDYYASCE